ncbi:MAG TPA: metallophosphoesterase [Verrucomicrobiae bacterium]|nr:metallophosphoesterase [Verrucomicrobiae bacterium]
MKAILRRCPILLLALGAALPTGADEVPVLSDAAKPFSFVVLGDLHYKRPDFETRKTVATIADSIRDCDPPVAFVCHTGDIAEGGTYSVKDGKRVFRLANHDETKEEISFAMEDVLGRFHLPFFIAVGNHDKHGGGTAFPEVFLPLVSRELRSEVTRSYYGFRHGNTCFVFLDFAAADLDAQRDFVLEFLARVRATPGVQHTFLFAHYPLWPLIRPGFSSERFTGSLMPIFKQFPVDAFFCGHTHNTCAWVRRIEGATITQIQGVACQSSPELVPMEQRRTLLLPADELSYFWGYVSGPPCGFFLVTVDEGVRVQLRSGAKVIREFAWRQSGKITDSIKPPPRPPVTVTEDALRQAKAVALVLCPWAEERAEIGVTLNGERVATAHIGPTMRSNAFVDETRIPIPAEKWELLRVANDLSIDNPKSAIFGLGHAYLEATLRDGRIARTGVSKRFLFSATEAEGNAARIAHGWKIIPGDAISSVSLGQPLGPVRLRFPVPER